MATIKDKQIRTGDDEARREDERHGATKRSRRSPKRCRTAINWPASWRRRTIALLRLQAEMQNLRNRTSREIADERKYAALPVLRDLLPVRRQHRPRDRSGGKGRRSRKPAGRVSGS